MRTSPDLGRLDRLNIEPGDDSKVTAAALQRPKQIRVVRLVHIGERAVGQDNLVVDHVAAGPADLVTVEVDAASQQQAGDTDGTDAAAGDGEAMGFEVFVDVGPAACISLFS